MKINKEGIDLIKEFEGLRLEPYVCPAGFWTNGYGTVLIENNQMMTSSNCSKEHANKINQIHSEEDAERVLTESIEEFSEDIRPLIKVELNENQFSACVALAYNIGVGAFSKSSVLKFINQNKFNDAANSFIMWNKATVRGKRVELAGLTRRRNMEKQLFMKD